MSAQLTDELAAERSGILGKITIQDILNLLNPYSVTGSGTDLISTISTVDLSTEQVSNPNYSLDSNEITVLLGGIYQIGYSVQVDEDSTSGGARGNVETSVEVNGAPLIQSRNRTYIRETSGGGGTSNSFIVSLSNNDVIRLRGVRAQGTTDVSVEFSQISLLRIG